MRSRHLDSDALTPAPHSTVAVLRRGLTLLPLVALGWRPTAGPLFAQTQGQPFPVEQVAYRNAEDATYLTATLTLPLGDGPYPGVVLLSIAGTDPMVRRLAGLGYAVLLPARRGFVAVEPLLQATYQDLATDARAAVDYFRSREDVDEAALAVIGQADDAPAAMLAVAGSADPLPLILLAPPGFPGTEVFRREQRWLAEGEGPGGRDLEALERHVDDIARIVLSEDSPYLREVRLQVLMAGSSTRLPYNAAFPDDERQAHFFASPLWHDRIAFDPEEALAQLHAPVLVLIGTDDPNTPMDAYLAAVQRGLAAARTEDWAVCRIAGRTRHTFTDEGVEAVAGWLGGRLDRAAGPAPVAPSAPQDCSQDPPSIRPLEKSGVHSRSTLHGGSKRSGRSATRTPRLTPLP